jgi:site-specific DNA recombinase
VGDARVSTPDQKSVPEQVEWIKADARSIDGELVDVFTAHGLSGSEIQHRLDLQQVRECVERELKTGRPLNTLSTWDGKRFSRADLLDTMSELKWLRDHGIRWIRTSEGEVDLYNPHDRLLLGIRQEAEYAAQPRANSRDVLRSMAARARAGFWQGGRAPFGYRIEGGRLVFGPDEEVELVKWIFFTMRDTATNPMRIARVLQSRGCKPPKGQRWDRETVRAILENRHYLGHYVWNKRHAGKHHKLVGGQVQPDEDLQTREQARRARGLKSLPNVVNSDEDVVYVPNVYPAIIDQDTFDAVQVKLNAKDRPCSPAREQVWPLGGLLVCAHCGQNVFCRGSNQRKPSGKTYKYKRVVCGNRVRYGKEACPQSRRVDHGSVLREVIRLLQEHLGDDGALAALREVVLRRAAQRSDELEKERETLTRNREDVVRLVAKGQKRLLEVDADMVADVQAGIREQKKILADVEERLEAVKAELAAAPATADAIRVDRALALVKSLHLLVELADQTGLKNALAGLLERVELSFEPHEDGTPRKGPKVILTLHPMFANLLNTVNPTSPAPTVVTSMAFARRSRNFSRKKMSSSRRRSARPTCASRKSRPR